MSKRKNRELEDILNWLTSLIFLSLIALWFTSRTKFYIYFSIIALALIAIIVVIKKIRKRRFNNVYDWHSGRSLIKKLQTMRPLEFEEYITDLYARLGFKAEVGRGSHDGGIDVTIQKNGLKHYIQCKKFITSKVGVADIRDFYGAMAGKLSNGKGIFITTNIFTTEAEKFSEDKPIELIDGDKLLKLIYSLTKKDREEMKLTYWLTKKNKEKIINSKDNKCSRCGGDMIEKNGKYGKFLGCSNYPKCKETRKL